MIMLYTPVVTCSVVVATVVGIPEKQKANCSIFFQLWRMKIECLTFLKQFGSFTKDSRLPKQLCPQSF